MIGPVPTTQVRRLVIRESGREVDMVAPQLAAPVTLTPEIDERPGGVPPEPTSTQLLSSLQQKRTVLPSGQVNMHSRNESGSEPERPFTVQLMPLSSQVPTIRAAELPLSRSMRTVTVGCGRSTQLPALHSQKPLAQVEQLPEVAGFTQLPLEQLSLVQGLPSLQCEALVHSTHMSVDSTHIRLPPQGLVPPVHVPPEHTSVPSQKLPSGHGVPSVSLADREQLPVSVEVEGSQVPPLQV